MQWCISQRCFFQGQQGCKKRNICWTPCRTPSNTSAWKCVEVHRPCSRATSGHQVENQQRNWRPKGGRRLGFTWLWLSLRETTSTCSKHLQRNEDALSNTWGQKNGVQFHYFMVFLCFLEEMGHFYTFLRCTSLMPPGSHGPGDAEVHKSSDQTTWRCVPFNR